MLEGHRANAPDEIGFSRQQTRGDVLDGLPLDGIARDQDPRLGVVRDQDKVRSIAGHLQAIDDQRAKAGYGLGGRTLRMGSTCSSRGSRVVVASSWVTICSAA